jgi:hypothetical protein
MGTVGLLSFCGMMFVILGRAISRAKERSHDPHDPLLPRAVAWAFATTVVVTFTIWPLSHGLGQMLVLIAAMGVAGIRQTAVTT